MDPGSGLDQRKCLREMVGTTRFELATSPTPRVRSTRLSHVPTVFRHAAREGDGGVMLHLQVYTRARGVGLFGTEDSHGLNERFESLQVLSLDPFDYPIIW